MTISTGSGGRNRIEGSHTHSHTHGFSLCLLVFSLFSASRINKGQAEKEGPRRGGVVDGAKGRREEREEDRQTAVPLLICPRMMEDGAVSEDPG